MNRAFDPTVTWDDLADLRSRWKGPLIVKGVMRADDAVRCVEHGADAIVVSNHGGRQLDGAAASIEALPAIADAVGDRAELYLDSGIRRGTDIVKALALGARAVLIGRALMYGLGAAGEAGARRAFAILEDELRVALALAGYPQAAGVGRRRGQLGSRRSRRPRAASSAPRGRVRRTVARPPPAGARDQRRGGGRRRVGGRSRHGRLGSIGIHPCTP